MMAEFQDYQWLKERGATPREVYRAGEANGLDAITLIRLVRKVFGLSLAEAKQVSGAAAILDAPQEVKVGAPVSWEAWTSIDGFFLVEARVKSIHEDMAELEDHREFRVTDEGLEERPASGLRRNSIRVVDLNQSLADRLANAIRFFHFARQQSFGEKQAI